jgi:NADH-quinone oxidoreductase subunit F
LFGVCGAVSRPGLYEAAMGTTLREVLEAAGADAEKPLKAILVGGTAGAFVSPEDVDMHLDFEGIGQRGGTIGSSVIYVANASDCIVDLLYKCSSVSCSRSCGKCVLCREGTYQLREILKDITEGKAKPEDLDLLVEIGESMRAGAFCGMGRSAANPVLTALSILKDEFEAHIRRKKCDAMVCKKYVSFFILPEKCQGCEKCLDVCPEDAIEGEEDMIHVIDQSSCTRCGKCFEVCPAEYSAVVKAGAIKPQVPKKPIPVGSWKKR